MPQVYCACSRTDDFRKPGIGMWEFFLEHHNAGIAPDKAQSFFVGDDVEGAKSSDT
jgi:bifunctional polynucleotide phosphatase/kinase